MGGGITLYASIAKKQSKMNKDFSVSFIFDTKTSKGRFKLNC